MITGHVGQNREAVVEIEISGPGGQWQPVQVVIDTGFTGLLVPPQVVSGSSVAVAERSPRRLRRRKRCGDDDASRQCVMARPSSLGYCS